MIDSIKYLILFCILCGSQYPLNSQNMPNSSCENLNQTYLNEITDIRKLEYIQEDSIFEIYLQNFEKICPCSFHTEYRKIILTSSTIKFHVFNQRQEAFDFLENKITLCKNINDTTTVSLLINKAILNLRNDDLVNMKKTLDEALYMYNKNIKTKINLYYSLKLKYVIYYEWKQDYESGMEILEKLENSIKIDKNIDSTLYLDILFKGINLSVAMNNLDLALQYSDQITKLVLGTKYETKTLEKLNYIKFHHFTDLKDIEKATEYFGKISPDLYNNYSNAMPIVNYYILTQQHEKASLLINTIENEVHFKNLPPHILIRVKIDLMKLAINNKNETLIDKIKNSINNNYINLINQSPEQQVSSVNLIKNWYSKLFDILESNEMKVDYSSIYNKLNNVKNSSSGYYYQLRNIIHNLKDDELEGYYNEYKSLCSELVNTHDAPNNKDSLNHISNKIQNKLEEKGIKWNSNVSLTHIKDALLDNDIFLDFYIENSNIGQEKMRVFIVDKHQLNVHIYKDVSKIFENKDPEISYINNGKKNKELYDLIWRPLEDNIKGKRRLYISTDAGLDLIALEILSSSGSKNNVLDDKFEIIFIENSKSLLEYNNLAHPSNLDNILLVGGIDYNCNILNNENGNTSDLTIRENSFDFLQGSKKEIELLHRKLTNPSINILSIMGCQAHKANIVEAFSNQKFSVIHIATHGIYKKSKKGKVTNYFDANSNAQLLLAKESILDDPYLSAIEITNQDFSQTNLIFLSACNTGLGDYLNGYGNASVGNAFKKAGAHKVVATLWPIPDDISVTFCDVFYSAYVLSGDANSALKIAKRTLKNSYSPEIWGAFRVLN